MDDRRHRVIGSPIGALTLVWDDGAAALSGLYVEHPPDDPALGVPTPGVPDGGADPLDAVAAAVAEYFAGRRRDFDGIPIAPRGTPFQQAVWAALRRVPHGETTTYGALATAIGRPTAARAVGAAGARNPVSLIVPCHRVRTASGRPAGAAERKRWLQALERGEES